MKTWAMFFGSSVGIWAKKVLVSLGIGVVTFTGFSVFEMQVRGYVMNAFNGLPAAAYSILALSGFVDVLGIGLATITSAIALVSFKRLGVLQS